MTEKKNQLASLFAACWKDEALKAGMLDCYLHHRPPNNASNCSCNPPEHVHCTDPPSGADCN